ncbi:MAG: GtrA family protein [Eubacteriales bacterium]|nr:GtrA family protein [Eubacteriales bacterium]
MINWLLQKWRSPAAAEFIRYLISGILVTALNFLVFSLLNRVLGLDLWYYSNLPAIVLSIFFAYFLNRYFVFRSQGPIWPEILNFFLSRSLVSLIFEYFSIWLLLDLIGWRRSLHLAGLSLPYAKIIAQFAVVFGNYIIGKYFIFKHKEQFDARIK